MSQKLVQFRGLCDKNIAAMDPDAVPDPFVPTSGDLAGFWDMVYIQVEHIHALFAELQEIRANGWQRKVKATTEKHSISPTNGGSTVAKKKKPLRPVSARTNAKTTTTVNNNDESKSSSTETPSSKQTSSSGKKSEAAKARDDARKKMMADRRKKMLELKQKTKGTCAENEKKDNELFFAI